MHEGYFVPLCNCSRQPYLPFTCPLLARYGTTASHNRLSPDPVPIPLRRPLPPTGHAALANVGRCPQAERPIQLFAPVLLVARLRNRHKLPAGRIVDGLVLNVHLAAGTASPGDVPRRSGDLVAVVSMSVVVMDRHGVVMVVASAVGAMRVRVGVREVWRSRAGAGLCQVEDRRTSGVRSL